MATSYRNGTLTGCVEEQPGPKYMLRDVKQGKLIAEVDPIVFPGQSLAKYVGRQARLQGRLSSGNDPAVMRVRTIKALSGPCAPAASSPSSPQSTTLKGCIDEQPGSKYVLRTGEKRELSAELEPAGFPVEHLARFLGHTVSIHGQLISGRTPPLLRVQAANDIKELSDQCIAE